MGNYLVYYVALGEKHRQMARLSIDSLYMSGYAGGCHVVTDAPIPLVYAPADKVVQVTDADTSVWHAKRAKAQYLLGLDNASTYDAILFTDCDTLVTGNVTPLLERIASSPSKLYVTNTAEADKNLNMRGTLVWSLMTPAERAANLNTKMVDSSGFGFKPTADNLAFVAAWNTANERRAALRLYKSDAAGLNLALVETGRMGDAECMVECERMSGAAAPTTIIRHYVNRSSAVLPRVFAGDVEQPYVTDQTSDDQPPADQPAKAA